MNNSDDIRRLLRSWPYDPEQPARLVRGDDGREVLQVRTPLGLEQLEMQGRPDGARPHGVESALEFHRKRLARAEAAGREANFELSAEDCAELFAEGTLFYLRYQHLFQLRRWTEAVRDTARNLGLFDFVHRHAAREEDRMHLEKWRPYLVRMNGAASALLALEQRDIAQSLKIIQTTLDRITALEELDDETFRFERKRSLAAMRALAKQVERMRPVPPLERLERQLRRAIEQQEFERAAELRDRIRALRARQPVG
jgi:hypothetical protein